METHRIMQWRELQICLTSQCTENTVDRYILMVFWMEHDDDQLHRVPCRRTGILKQMAEVGSAVVYKTARRNVSAINFGWMPNASFKRRKKGCQIMQYGVCLALLDESFSDKLIAWCEMHIWSNLCKMILHLMSLYTDLNYWPEAKEKGNVERWSYIEWC